MVAECPLCSAPVARAGTVCTPCDLERQFGTGDYDDDPDDVRHPLDRDTEYYYESDDWTVVDVEDLDRWFATKNEGLDGEPGEIRIDVDGHATGDDGVGELGDRIQVSIWFTVEQFNELVARALLPSDVDIRRRGGGR